MTVLLAMSFSDGLLEGVYVLTGVVLFIFAGLTLLDKRHPHPIASALFWSVLGVIFVFGSFLPHGVTGVLVLVMVGLDGVGRVKPRAAGAPDIGQRASHGMPTPALTVQPEITQIAAGEGMAPAHGSRAPTADHVGVLSYEPREPREPRQLGNRIFLPVLAIPAVTIIFAAIFRIAGLDVNKGALIGLGFGGLAAMAVALWLTRGTIGDLMDDGRRLNECMGAVNILPQLLASLGIIFTAAGIGNLIAQGVEKVVPHSLFLLMAANCLGMTLFTMVMGNSFAAFPVIASGVLVPLIVKPFGVDPAMAAIITLTAGSSGTLITPMAANFNIVPAALLELKNPYGVMKFQLPFALIIWPLHVVVMWGLWRMLG